MGVNGKLDGFAVVSLVKLPPLPPPKFLKPVLFNYEAD
jgi:hypothetical protein